MDGFDRNLTHSLFGLRVDLTDNKDAHEHHSSATAECNGNSFETDIGELQLLFAVMKVGRRLLHCKLHRNDGERHRQIN